MNNEAIGNVTVAIRNLLQQGLGNDYEVSLCSPWEDLDAEKGVNLFLYKVAENPQWKNMDWPGDRSNPSKIPVSPLSLDLFYLLTPFAPKVTMAISDIAQNHRILGKAMQILHENSILNDTHTPYFDADKNELFPEDLRNSFEKIKISLNPIDMEELSKLWSMGNKPYKLSVAYHVSLVQIAPTTPAKPIAPLIQEIGVKDAETMVMPVIAKLDPSQGPVGSQLRISGKNLWLKGFKTTVKCNDTLIMDFISVTEDEIVFTVPLDLQRGPETKIKVFINGSESKPRPFRVSPWISSIKPQRGAVEGKDAQAVPIGIHGYDLQGDVQIRIGGVTVAPLDITVVSENLIKTYIPKTLPNGYHDIDLKVNGNPANKRVFEVIPLIKRIIPLQARTGSSIRINGKRLKGDEIRISIGTSVIIAEANPNPNRISLNVPKALTPGRYEVKVSIDGHESNGVPFEVIE